MKKDKRYSNSIYKKNSVTFEILKNGLLYILFGIVFYIIYKYVIPFICSYFNDVVTPVV